MNNMRRGFTMIELIFVIVIIGILAAVAIPKLAATRSDAEGAKIANNLATCINEIGGAYLKDGNFTKISSNATALTESTVTTVACLSAADCFDLNGTSSAGSLSVSDDNTTSEAKCTEAQSLASKNSMSGTTHSF